MKVHSQAPSHLSLKSASLSWKPPPMTVARELWKDCRQRFTVKVSLCIYTLRLTLIHARVDAILYSCKLNFPALRRREIDSPFSLSRVQTGSSTASRGDDWEDGFVCSA